MDDTAKSVTEDMTESMVNGSIKDEKKKVSVTHHMLIMLVFSVTLLIVGYIVTKDQPVMLMPLMFVLVFGMRTINNSVKG